MEDQYELLSLGTCIWKNICHRVHIHDESGERTFGKTNFYNACMAETLGIAILESRWDERDRQIDFMEVVQLQDFQSLRVLCSGCGYSKLRDFPCPWPQCKIQVSSIVLSEDLESTRHFAQRSQRESRDPDQVDDKDELDGDTEEKNMTRYW